MNEDYCKVNETSNKITIPLEYNIVIPEDKLIIEGIDGLEKFINYVALFCQKGIDLYLPKVEFHFLNRRLKSKERREDESLK